MTFSALRALHAIIGDALDKIESVYAFHESHLSPPTANNVKNASQPGQHHQQQQQPSHQRVTSLSKIYASPPPSPCIITEHHSSFAAGPSPPPLPPPLPPQLDFPSLDTPCDPSSLSETLTQHPDVISASTRIIAACGQMAVTLQTPFMSLCDAIMQYHLPSCLRILEASNTPEILREAGPLGLHVDVISHKTRVEKTKLAHILRLLATHHIIREVSPDVFALNRISSTIDTGKDFWDLQKWIAQGTPEKKYENTSGVAAFVGLCTDEIFKSSAFLTETYLLSSSRTTRAARDPTRAPFCTAFEAQTEYFGWLEGGGGGRGQAEPHLPPHTYSSSSVPVQDSRFVKNPLGTLYAPTDNYDDDYHHHPNLNRFRLERFGKAMSSTSSWETPDAILNSFDWHSLPRGSIIVDVGGGVGSTSMLLANAFSSGGENDLGLKFIIQDRPGTIEIGEKNWKDKCPEFLKNGTARFQSHDFFTPQPTTTPTATTTAAAAVFLLRVVLHDWPDHVARRILLHLREAAGPDTKLLLGDFILPLACAYNDESSSSGGGGGGGILEGIQGLESVLAPPPAPLLSNLGKANSVAYWMDLTMGVMFNAQERTLQEIVKLTASAGWKVTRVTKCSRSLFGYLVAVVDTVPSPSPPPPPPPPPRPQSRYCPSLPPPLPHPSRSRVVTVDSCRTTTTGWNRHHEDDDDNDEPRDLMDRLPPSPRYGIPVFDDVHIQLPPFTQEVSAWFNDRGPAATAAAAGLYNPVGGATAPVDRVTVTATRMPPPPPPPPAAVPKKRPSPLSLTSSTISSHHHHHEANTRVTVASPSPPLPLPLPPAAAAAAATVRPPSLKKAKSISKWSSLMNLRAHANSSGGGDGSTAPSNKSLRQAAAVPVPLSPRSPLTPTSPPPLPPPQAHGHSQPQQKTTTTTQGLPRKKSLSSLIKWRSESQQQHSHTTAAAAPPRHLIPARYNDSSDFSESQISPSYHYRRTTTTTTAVPAQGSMSGGGVVPSPSCHNGDDDGDTFYAKPSSSMVVQEPRERLMANMTHKSSSFTGGEDLEEVSIHSLWRGGQQQQQQQQRNKTIVGVPLPPPPPPPPPPRRLPSPPPPTSRGSSRLQRIKSVPSLLAKAARQHRLLQPHPPLPPLPPQQYTAGGGGGGGTLLLDDQSDTASYFSSSTRR